MSTRRFQTNDERPRSAREITSDANPERPVILGESRYHKAAEFPSGEILGFCGNINGDDATLVEAARRGLRPCDSCSPPEYLADPDTEDVIEERADDELAADLTRLSPGDSVGLTYHSQQADGAMTAEGVTQPTEDAATLASIDASTHVAPLTVRRDADGLTVYSDTAVGPKRLGGLLDVHDLEVRPTNDAGGEPEVATDGGEDDQPERNTHSSALAETLRQADDDDLEAAGVDPDDVPGEDGDGDE